MHGFAEVPWCDERTISLGTLKRTHARRKKQYIWVHARRNRINRAGALIQWSAHHFLVVRRCSETGSTEQLLGRMRKVARSTTEQAH